MEPDWLAVPFWCLKRRFPNPRHYIGINYIPHSCDRLARLCVPHRQRDTTQLMLYSLWPVFSIDPLQSSDELR